MISEIIRRYSTTAIIVTHDIMDAMKISDRIIVIDNGIILMSIPQEFQLVVPGVILILAVYFDTLRKEKNG